MKVLVCGGRDFKDGMWLYRELDALHTNRTIEVIIQGGARGADLLAAGWAEKNAVPCLTVHADWEQYGKSAGYKRNSKMLEYEPDWVLAFPGGKGTKMMCEIARRAGVFVKEIV